MEIAVPVTTKITVEEFAAIAGAADERLELVNGEIVHMPPPKWSHYRIQNRLADMLRAVLASAGVVSIEMPYRSAAGNIRVADVAFMSQSRFDAVEGMYPHQAPELVIEVSSDESHLELSARRADSYESGALEFWIVEPVLRTIMVSRPSGESHIYTPGDRVPVPFVEGASLAVDEILP